MTTNYKKELRSLFDKLMQVETSCQQSFYEAPSYSYYHEIMDSFNASDMRAQAIKNIATNPSYAEAFVLDAIYKIEALERDSSLRRKNRLDYLSDAFTDCSREVRRLDISKFNSLQFALGNADIQKKSDA